VVLIESIGENFVMNFLQNTLPSTKGINKLTTKAKFYGLPRNLLENTIWFLKKN